METKFYTTLNQEHLFQKSELFSLDIKVDDVISMDQDVFYQTIDGFGASFTDSAAFLVDKILKDKDKVQAMEKLFDPEKGIGLSLLRNPMGASDYARSVYSYHDIPVGKVDKELKDFSIHHDMESILPLTKWAIQLNPEMKVLASPWSAPGWMKTTGEMIAGKLLKENYDSYAKYFVKFIKAYLEEGVAIYGVTPQNEPLFEPKHYPSMEMLAAEEADFVKNYLRPAFNEEKISTKIFGYDHNWDRIDYAFDIYDLAKEAFDGIAWHWYGGNPESQSRINKFYPDKEVHFTEGSGGEWIPEFEPAFSNLIRTGIDILKNDSRSFILWNVALDEENGPTVPGFGNSTCRGLLRISQQDHSLEYTLDYYGLAHFSKFIRPGAKRIHSTNKKSEEIKQIIFENLDKSIVAVLFNDSDRKQIISIHNNKQNLVSTIALPAKAAGTWVHIP